MNQSLLMSGSLNGDDGAPPASSINYGSVVQAGGGSPPSTSTTHLHRKGKGGGGSISVDTHREESMEAGLTPSPHNDSIPSLDHSAHRNHRGRISHPGSEDSIDHKGSSISSPAHVLFASPPPLPPAAREDDDSYVHHQNPPSNSSHQLSNKLATNCPHPTVNIGDSVSGSPRGYEVGCGDYQRSASIASTAAVSMPDMVTGLSPISIYDHDEDDANVVVADNKNDSERKLLENSDSDFPPPEEIPMSPTTEQKTMRSAFFAVFPVFMAYAALVTLQGNLKQRMGIGNDESSDSVKFSFATSLCYLGNLIFRLLHNLLFCKLTPRYRVCISYVCLAAAMLILGIVYFAFDDPDNKAFSRVRNLGPVYVAYLLGGVAIGTFESNLLSVITPLGHGTKVWAQYGIPIGFNGISVGAFILLASLPQFEVPLQATIYCGVGACNILGLFFFLLRVPDVPFESTSTSILHFLHDLRRFKEWVPLVWTFAAALAVDMFAVSLCSALQQFIYQSSSLPLFSFGTDAMRAEVIPRNVHRAVFNGASLIGDTVGRKLAYRTSKHVHPFWFLIATVLGVAIVLSKQPLVAPIGMLLVMFANGSVYAHTTKYVDDCVDRRYNLIALSFWLFVGDAGSFIGANVVSPLRGLVGGD